MSQKTRTYTLREYTIYQDYDAPHPFEDLSFQEIGDVMRDVYEQWGHQYHRFRLERKIKSYGFGAYSEWFELVAEDIFAAKMEEVIK